MNKWEFIKKNYIDKGLKIFPIVPNGKTPLIEKWQNECSSDYFQILYWYENCPDCNWALPATENDLFILDLDKHDLNKDGVENYEKLLTDNDIEFDPLATLKQATPSGGRHIFFKTDNELKGVMNSANTFKDYPGIDIRTSGYCVVEPSEINNKKYYLVNPNKPISEMPDKLKEYIIKNTTQKSDIKKEPYKKPRSVECGDRDNQLFSYINNIYYKTQLDFDEILCLANYFNENVLEKPFSEKVVKYKVRKVFDKERDKFIFINLGQPE